MTGLAYACYGKGCGWIFSYLWFWHRVHWWAVPIMIAIVFLVSFIGGFFKAMVGR